MHTLLSYLVTCSVHVHLHTKSLGEAKGSTFACRGWHQQLHASVSATSWSVLFTVMKKLKKMTTGRLLR